MAVSYYLAGKMESSSVVYVPKGSIQSIISHLNKNNFQLTSVDSYMLRLFGDPQHGWIHVGYTKLSHGDFLHRLATGKAALQKVTLIPGETMYFNIRKIAKEFALSSVSLKQYYDSYAPYNDGVILPDTYHIPIGINEQHIMYYLVNRSMSLHKKLARKILGVYDQTQWFKYVTIASIIQKEAANIEEMPLISAVIHNRIKRGMRLQMDGTLNYGRYSHTKVTPYRIKNNSSHFNTYKIRGIPPEPVAGAGLEAIKAAISPADADYLYFVKNKNGTHTFSKSYKSHLRNIKGEKN